VRTLEVRTLAVRTLAVRTLAVRAELEKNRRSAGAIGYNSLGNIAHKGRAARGA
jgi:hypothetical protein